MQDAGIYCNVQVYIIIITMFKVISIYSTDVLYSLYY